MSAKEVWGAKASLDQQFVFFQIFFEDVGVVNLAPFPLRPTWRNGRVGEDGIAKRLDRFFLNEHFLGELFRSRAWTVNSLISYHNTICLQLQGTGYLPKFPFKFNHAWLKEPDFKSLVEEC